MSTKLLLIFLFFSYFLIQSFLFFLFSQSWVSYFPIFLNNHAAGHPALCPIHFTLSDTKGDWRPIRPPNRVSRVPDYLILIQYGPGLVSGQIDSPYLFIMSLITIPRDEYHTAHGSCRLPRHGRYSLIGTAQLLLRSRLSKREHC